MCLKVPYDSYKQALEAARGFNIRKKENASPYKCPHCEKFHLTTGKKKLPKLKDKYKFEIPEYNPLKPIKVSVSKKVKKQIREIRPSTEKVFRSLFAQFKKAI